jgi:type III restriction enzyme
MEYQDRDQNRRLYYPDFIAVTTEGRYLIIETKGREDVDVAYKDKRAVQWCLDAERITGKMWSFKRVDEDKFRSQPYINIKNI